MKTELASLHGATMNSTNLLTEKLALARELSSLRPENDHLRSQAASHQALLAEKLSLQRQVNTLQVELDNEKRSVRRTIAKECKEQEEDTKLDSQVESLRIDLSKERKERQKADRDAQRKSAELESKLIAAESRSECFKDKLKTTKDLLKETRSELRGFRSANSRASAHGPVATTNLPNPRKRVAARMDDQTMIGTPGDAQARKRDRKVSSMVGDKSTFSITPFLNRTATVAPESPSNHRREQNDTEQSLDSMRHGSYDPSVPTAEAPGILWSNQSVEKAMKCTLDPVNPSKLNMEGSMTRRTKNFAPRLEGVAEEENDQGKQHTPQEPTAKEVASDDTILGGAQLRKTKRRLLGGALGKTLFDDEDVDAQAVRGRGVTGIGFGKFGIAGQRPTAITTSTLKNISPLKRDKRVGFT